MPGMFVWRTPVRAGFASMTHEQKYWFDCSEGIRPRKRNTDAVGILLLPGVGGSQEKSWGHLSET